MHAWHDDTTAERRKKAYYQTGPFTITKPRDQEIGEFYYVHECHVSDLEAPKL